MTPITCGLYMQPFWSSITVCVGTCQFWSGRPDLIHTNAYFKVPLSFTTTSSDFAGPDECARTQNGVADMSSDLITGFVPSNDTLPVTVAPLASSGAAAAPPPAGAAGSAFFAVSGVPPPPHPAKARTPANASPTK